jgi:Putative peptidoglycan binding domain
MFMLLSSMPRALMRTFTAVLALGGFLLAAAAPAMAQGQTPPINFDGTNTTFFITANSMLRYGDSLLSKHYMTVGAEGMQIKGRGPCTVFVCPVTFNGIDLFARRSRLRLDGPVAGTGGGGSYGGGSGKGCAGITRTLRRGDENNEVRILQEILIKAGFPMTADGKYGRKTVAAVEQLQRRARINADGTVGPKTLAILPC